MFVVDNHFRSGFTLVELLVSVSILLLLAAIALPSFLDALVKAKVAKSQSDMLGIKKAIEMYYLDHKMYPPNAIDPMLTVEIDLVKSLFEPIAYLSSVPQFPWRNTYGVFRSPITDGEKMLSLRLNYEVSTESDPAVVRNRFFTDWTISSSGPQSVGSGYLPKNWYNITNGVISDGGFWMDSRGRNSFR